MLVHATRSEEADVRRELEHSPTVARFAFVDHHDALTVARRIFRKNKKLANSLKAVDLPTSFRVDLRSLDARDAFISHFEALPGVDSVEHPFTAAERERALKLKARSEACGTVADAEIFMKVNATPAEEDAVADALARIGGIASVKRLSHEDAKAAFDCLFADDPRLAGATAAELPVSFRLEFDDPTALERVLRTIYPMSGVDTIQH